MKLYKLILVCLSVLVLAVSGDYGCERKKVAPEETKEDLEEGGPDVGGVIPGDFDGDGIPDDQDPDADGDGVAKADGDCNDLDPSVHPGVADKPDAGYVDSNCDLVDGDINSIWVSIVEGNDETGDGSITKPFASLTHAVQVVEADGGNKDILVVYSYVKDEDGTLRPSGLYNGAVKIVGCEGIYGGYSELVYKDGKPMRNRNIDSYKTILLQAGNKAVVSLSPQDPGECVRVVQGFDIRNPAGYAAIDLGRTDAKIEYNKIRGFADFLNPTTAVGIRVKNDMKNITYDINNNFITINSTSAESSDSSVLNGSFGIYSPVQVKINFNIKDNKIEVSNSKLMAAGILIHGPKSSVDIEGNDITVGIQEEGVVSVPSEEAGKSSGIVLGLKADGSEDFIGSAIVSENKIKVIDGTKTVTGITIYSYSLDSKIFNNMIVVGNGSGGSLLTIGMGIVEYKGFIANNTILLNATNATMAQVTAIYNVVASGYEDIANNIFDAVPFDPAAFQPDEQPQRLGIVVVEDKVLKGVNNNFFSVDNSKLKNPDCYVYLSDRYVAEKTDDEPGTLSPMETSYIISALIRDGSQAERELARNLLDNLFFELNRYGYPPSSNRGYALSRSQNNIIPANLWEYFQMTKNHAWLENVGIPFATKIIEYWKTRIGSVSLDNEDSEEGYRWFASGKGPRQEAWGSSKNPNPYYYRKLYNLIGLALTPDPKKPDFAKGFDYNRVVHVSNENELNIWRNKKALNPVEIKDGELKSAKTYVLKGTAGTVKTDQPVIEIKGVFYTLTPKFFANDRAAVVSGYNPGNLYGPYNAFVDEFIDAAHNIQLYKAGVDLAKMYQAMADRYDGVEKKKAKTFREKVELYESEAEEIKKIIMKHLWDEKLGMIFNYSYHSHTRRTSYPFITGGYAIWAGLFDTEKPKEVKMLMRLVDYLTENLEGPEGFYATTVETGLMWEKPNVIPLPQGIIVSGLVKYAAALEKKEMKEEAKKLRDIAKRVSAKYLKAKQKSGDALKNAAAMASIIDLYSPGH